jgi:ERCC4-type nuclease
MSSPAYRGSMADVSVISLTAGDYQIDSSTLVERKRVADLHDSLIRGRFWRQLGNLKASAAAGFLLVEGMDLDDGPLHPNSVRGALLAVVEQGIAILRSRDRNDSARWPYRLAARSIRTKPLARNPVYAQRPTRPGLRPEAALLAAVPGISVELAHALLSEFGSIAAVVQAGRTELLRVPGIGETRAGALEAAFQASQTVGPPPNRPPTTRVRGSAQ